LRRSDFGLGRFKPSAEGGLLEFWLFNAKRPSSSANTGRQNIHLGQQHRHLREKRTDQVVFLAMAKLIKVGQCCHAFQHNLNNLFYALELTEIFDGPE
jgi:hypothetical protein